MTWLTSAEYDDSIGEKGNAVGGGSLDLVSDPEVDRDGLRDLGEPGTDIIFVVGVIKDGE